MIHVYWCVRCGETKYHPLDASYHEENIHSEIRKIGTL